MVDRIGRLWKRVRRFRVVLWFVLGLVVLDRAVAARARLWDGYDHHPYRELMARCRESRWDLLVVGGSPAMCALDPAVLAGTPWPDGPLRTAYNLGLPLATAEEVCLAAEYGPAAPPRLLVYGATATDFNNRRVERGAAEHLMTVADFGRAVSGRPASSWRYTRFFVGERLAQAWQLFYHRRGVRRWLADTADGLWPGICPAAAAEARTELAVSTLLRTGLGNCLHQPVTAAVRLDARKAAGQITDNFPFMDDYRVGEAYLACLDRMLAGAAARGVQVVIVDVPVPADLDQRLFPEQFAAYRAALARAATAHGVPVVWATTATVGLTDADFSDLVHLNGNGAARFSGWLRETLAAGVTR
jgi:hypothetical protein